MKSIVIARLCVLCCAWPIITGAAHAQGVLTGSMALSPPDVNLTLEGTAD